MKQFEQLTVELEEPFRTMAQIAVCFGLRISELLALQWADVDWLNSKLRIRRAIVMQNLDEVKTEESRQDMAIAAELVKVSSNGVKQHNSQPIRIGFSPVRFS